MIRRAAILAAAIAVLVSVVPGAPRADTADACLATPHPPIAAPRLAAAARRGELRIIAFGSSSTAGAGASLPWRSYPARLEAMLREALPGVRVTVMNRGVGGEDAANMIGRLDGQVVAEAPDLVIWQVGANAALRRMAPESFLAFVSDGLRRLQGAGIDVVLMDNQRAPRIASRPGHRAYDTMLATAAAAMPGVGVFSRGAMMDAWGRAGIPNEALLDRDGLHHNDRGYACVAAALGQALLAAMPGAQRP